MLVPNAAFFGELALVLALAVVPTLWAVIDVSKRPALFTRPVSVSGRHNAWKC